MLDLEFNVQNRKENNVLNMYSFKIKDQTLVKKQQHLPLPYPLTMLIEIFTTDFAFI